MIKTTYVTLRIDFEVSDSSQLDESEAREQAAEMVVERASYHNHTVENGVTIESLELCGFNSTEGNDDIL